MQPRSAQSCKIYPALRHCNIVICTCNSSSYLIRLSIKPIHPYSRLATDCNSAAANKFTLIGTLFGCIFLISSILYNTHPPPSISSFSQYFSLCSSVVSSSASYYYLSPCNLLFPLPLPLVQTLPFPHCCNKNSVKLNLFVSLALAKRTTSKVK